MSFSSWAESCWQSCCYLVKSVELGFSLTCYLCWVIAWPDVWLLVLQHVSHADEQPHPLSHPVDACVSSSTHFRKAIRGAMLPGFSCPGPDLDSSREGAHALLKEIFVFSSPSLCLPSKCEHSPVELSSLATEKLPCGSARSSAARKPRERFHSRK